MVIKPVREYDGSMPNQSWEAVFWDLGGVILDLSSVREAHRDFLAALVDEHGLETSVDDALKVWRDAVGTHFREREGTTFRAARDGYAKGVAAVVGERLPAAMWRPAFEEAIASAIRPVPGAVETIERLNDRNLHLGVVSDVDTDEARRILAQFGVLGCFDSITTSEAVGRTKPDPAMFETALEETCADPTRSLMIGDRYRHDVAGAKALGLRTAGLGLDLDAGPDLDYPIESPCEILDIIDGDWSA